MNDISQHSGAIAIKVIMCEECWGLISPGERFLALERERDKGAPSHRMTHLVCPD